MTSRLAVAAAALGLAALLILTDVPSIASEGFGSCAASFPGDTVAGAPRRTNPTAATTADSVSLCYHQSGTAFFALDYSIKRLTANWVAHKLENSFGENGCGSVPRDDMQCYFKKEPDKLAACLGKKNGPGDPFHIDPTLTTLDKARIPPSTYSGSGHDQGHLAPNQSFSWHICGTYKTFTMANMAPQLATLNRGLWANLEQQVLFWAVKEGPVYVVTGSTFTTFPAEKFHVISNGTVKKSKIVKPNAKLKPGESGVAGKVIKPTGFYKVILRPGRDGDPDRAVGFLVPHTTSAMTGVSYGQFVARIDVIEKASGYTFAVPDALKGAGGQAWWLERKPGNFKLRSDSCTVDDVPQAWQPTLSVAERTVACQSE